MSIATRSRIDSASLELKDLLVSLNRTAKVVKGGRRFGFAAMVVVGDGAGHVGFGLGHSKEVPEAIAKGVEAAKKSLVTVPLVGTTLPAFTRGVYGASQVILRPAAPGTGVVAGGATRKVLEVTGVRDVIGKSLGSNNPHNVVRATFEAFRVLQSTATSRKLRQAALTRTSEEKSE